MSPYPIAPPSEEEILAELIEQQTKTASPQRVAPPSSQQSVVPAPRGRNWLPESLLVMSPHDALRLVTSGLRVYIHPGRAEPEVLVEALIDRAPFVQDVEIVHLLTLGRADYIRPEMAGHFRHNAMFIGGNVREAVNDGRCARTRCLQRPAQSQFGLEQSWEKVLP